MDDTHDREIVEQIIVRGARTSTAMKMDAPIIEVPQNIQVLSAKFIDDIGADLLEDALRHVAGIAVGGYYNGWDYYRIRGFDGVSYLDGLRGDTLSINAEIFGLDRVEVLKGPSSTLYGEGLLSGMVNMISKRPKKEAFADVGMTYGQHDFSEGTLDFGGSLNNSRSVYARLPVLYREQGTFVEIADGLRRFYVAPSLTWDIADRTRVTFLSTYQKDRDEVAYPLPARGTVLPNVSGKIPLDRFVGDGLDPNYTKNESYALGYQFSHDFNDALSFRQSLRYREHERQWYRLLYPSFLDADQRTLYRFPYYLDGSVTHSLAVDTGFEFKLATLGIEHHATVGIDYTSRRSHEVGRADYANLSPIDVFAPVDQGAAEVDVADLIASPYAAREHSLGFYVQDLMRLTQRLSFMIGGRYQQIKGGSTYTSTDPDDARMIGGNALVPNAGFSYQLRSGLHAYASYSEAFRGQFAYPIVGGGKAPPEEGTQYEAGVKAGRPRSIAPKSNAGNCWRDSATARMWLRCSRLFRARRNSWRSGSRWACKGISKHVRRRGRFCAP